MFCPPSPGIPRVFHADVEQKLGCIKYRNRIDYLLPGSIFLVYRYVVCIKLDSRIRFPTLPVTAINTRHAAPSPSAMMAREIETSATRYSSAYLLAPFFLSKAAPAPPPLRLDAVSDPAVPYTKRRRIPTRLQRQQKKQEQTNEATRL